jgi:hypothetical protein
VQYRPSYPNSVELYSVKVKKDAGLCNVALVVTLTNGERRHQTCEVDSIGWKNAFSDSANGRKGVDLHSSRQGGGCVSGRVLASADYS